MKRYWALPVGVLVCLFAFTLAASSFGGIELGSVNAPRPGYVAVTAFWALLGSFAAILLALFLLATVLDSPRHIDRLVEQWNALDERYFTVAACAAAFIIPVLLRFLVLHNAPVTDDEGAYRFAAQLMASGRLWVESPPMKLFFDQNFIVNDGRMYAVYFPGWPALLALGELIHAPALVNPTLSALTVIPLTAILTPVAGRAWAGVGILLFLSAPFVQIGAATDLSHTSCLATLTWALALCLRLWSGTRTRRDYASFAFALALAFCIRPHVAAALGVPMVIAAMMTLSGRSASEKRRAALAFLAPAALMAIAFLAILWMQNGSPFTVGYEAYRRYAIANDFRFTGFWPSQFTSVGGFDVSIGGGLARTAAGIYRLNFDLFGWPSSFVFLLFAAFSVAGATRLIWTILGTFLILAFAESDWGVDTFGPVHAFESALPLIVLTVVGVQRLTVFLQGRPSSGRMPWQWQALPMALLVSLVMTAWMGFIPLRLEVIDRVSRHVSSALTAPEREGAHHAVVFAPWPFAPLCADDVPDHFVAFRPVNDPDLENDVIWANHIDVEQDRALAARLGGRTPYLLRWTAQCRPELVRLDRVSATDIPPGPIRRSEWTRPKKASAP